MWIIILAACLGLQEKQPGDDAILLRSGGELRGAIESMDPSGTVRFHDRAADRKLDIPVEETLRWRLGEPGDRTPLESGMTLLRLRGTGVLRGRLTAYRDGVATLRTEVGTFAIPREGLDAIVLREGWTGRAGGSGPDLLAENGKDEAVGGRLVEIDKDVVFESGETVRHDRDLISEVRFLHAGPSPAAQPGWFAKIHLSNGDHFLAVARSLDRERLCAFSPVLGRLELPRNRVREIVFVPSTQVAAGCVLVCDRLGVREIVIETGKVVWSYPLDGKQAFFARKLENGNVLLGMSEGLLEVTPAPPAGGTVAWKLDCMNAPCAGERLDNGHTLCAEHAANRVVEYDREGKVVWSAGVRFPMSVQRLEGGRTLVCNARQQVVELDAEGKVAWRLPATVNPLHAVRLDNGRTLLTCMNDSVIEIDRNGKTVWRVDDLSDPKSAARCDDGTTLILETGQGRLIRVDAAGKVVGQITGLEGPVGFSAY